MISSKSQLAIAVLATAAHAFDSISVPANVTAGQPFTLTTTTNDTDSSYTSYRVYLDTTPPGYEGGPSCKPFSSPAHFPPLHPLPTNPTTGYLKNTTSISTTSLNLTIPADLGPPGTFYSLSTRELPLNTTDTLTTSAPFTLSNATGNWSAYEDALKGAPLWPADALPCAAYACARACAMRDYPGDLDGGEAAHEAMAACILDCPGVTVPEVTNGVGKGSDASAAPSASAGTGAASVHGVSLALVVVGAGFAALF